LSAAHNLLGCPTRIHKRLQLLPLFGVDLEWGCRTKHTERIRSISGGATHFQLVVLSYGNERLRSETRWPATVPERDASRDQPEQADAVPRMSRCANLLGAATAPPRTPQRFTTTNAHRETDTARRRTPSRFVRAAAGRAPASDSLSPGPLSRALLIVRRPATPLRNGVREIVMFSTGHVTA
jgi:hypothetical protein